MSEILVDGSSLEVDLDPDRTLLHVLRDELGVTAPKYGCGEGECGACKVLLDGEVVPACITPVADAAGRAVTTAAGLGGEVLHPVQQAFAEIGAMQCGYCTPGMVVTAAALLTADPDPSPEAIRAALEGNVCRCCTYPRIERAVRRAVELTAHPSDARARPLDPETTLPRPAWPWDLLKPEERDYFEVLPDGVVAVLPPGAVPDGVWSASGGAWIHLATDGAVTAFTGKVEVGQDNRTMLSQVVAEELAGALDRVRMVMGDTDLCPFDEGTFGSLSAPDAATVLRATAAALRDLLAGELPEPGTRAVEIVASDAPVWASEDWTLVGTPAPRVRGIDAVTGAKRFPSDVTVPGMLHGSVLRPPTAGAALVSADVSAAEAMPGVVVVSDGDLVGAVAADPLTARRAIDAVVAAWETAPPLAEADLTEHFRAHPVESLGWGGSSREETGDVDTALAAAPVTTGATYTTGYIAHVSLEPRVAVAEWSEGRLTVWTGSQRPFGVRDQLAEALGIEVANVRVIVPDTGSGFGGKHSPEVAIEAARLARAAGAPVKMAWTREEEFRFAYFRPAAVIDVTAATDADGRLTAWDVLNLNAGSVGITTPYNIPNVRTEYQPTASPLRQGSYRALAATANHFARESHMDEVAHALGVDPVEFRVAHLDDERLVEVLRASAERAGWGDRSGLGVACGIEKDARVATCAEVRVDRSGRLAVLRVVTAFDCGAVINPGNLVGQIEGTTIMGLGGALFEAIHFADGQILNPRLSEYRVPRFSDVPEIEVVLIDHPDEPSAGAGETPIVAVAPAVANAIFALTGIRLRSLPLAPDGLVPTGSG